MTKVSRRKLLHTAGVGGLAAGAGLIGPLGIIGKAQAQTAPGLAQATVAFGAWHGDQLWDRTSPEFNPIEANHHTVLPREVRIKAGGSVSYVISGFHQIIAYDDGTQPESINTNSLILSQGPLAPPFPILIDDPSNRIFRGVDPGNQTLDRVETITFSRPGRYLVICGVIFHFAADGMFGFVTVLP